MRLGSTAVLIFGLAPATTFAQTAGRVDAAMAHYREMTSTAGPEKSCTTEAKDAKDDILVCGRSLTQRLPLPDERGPPDTPRQRTGDPRAALDNSGRPCPPTGCTGVNLFNVPVVIVRVFQKLIDPDR